ncbi:copper amine oxidase N-terminal domain-containing protein [Cohnella sp. GbtcB17]|uniref:copper amine oxidase N-terminal domain-containing protein n=1 Tax=Cohnella sp. GbtcB17 TaxID=2824762 RepID=UPI001C2F195E|nr:copper amine oxidase N-terminal domain-containing protein [Cohnella sp. GbtcB17]
MRKIIVGMLIGAALMFGIQAGAASLAGSKVAGTKDVTLYGKAIGQAAIINNSSYLPVRSLSEALGLGIDLSGGKINLSKQEQPTSSTTPSPTATATPTPTNAGMSEEQIKSRLGEVDKWLKSSQDDKAHWESEIELYKKQGYQESNYKIQLDSIRYAEEAIAKLTAEKAQLEAQLQQLQNQ